MLKYLLAFVIGSIFTIIIIAFYYPKQDYKNTISFTNGYIQIEEGIKSIDKNFNRDKPAGIYISINQVKPNDYGECNIKTDKTETAYISLEHLNMLDHFAYRYLEKKDDGWSGGCRLIINNEEMNGKNLK